MATDTWKKTERTVARRLGGTRVGPSGRATADVVTEHLSIECKHRKQLPDWLKDAMQQSLGAAEPAQLAIVVLHEKQKKHDNDLVVLRLKDFEAWYGPVTLKAVENDASNS